MTDDESLPRRRRVLRKIKISEISAVDHPAHEGALMAIMKRGPSDERTLDDRLDDLRLRADDVEAALAKAAAVLADRQRGTGSAQQRKERTMADLVDLARDIAKRDGCSSTAALCRARQEHPAAFENYNAAPVAKRGSDHLDAGADDVDNKLEKHAHEIRGRDGCSNAEALRRARHEHPQAFERLRAR